MRSWKYFNEEEATKFAKGNLALQNIPLTEENVKNELEDVYANWLALKLNDIIHASDGLNSGVEVCAFYRKLKTIPTKYYSIVLQWLYNEPIHYEGKYFNFEEIYDNERFREEEEKEENDVLEFNILFESINFFIYYEYEEPKFKSKHKYVNSLKNHLSYIICQKFFH